MTCQDCHNRLIKRCAIFSKIMEYRKTLTERKRNSLFTFIPGEFCLLNCSKSHGKYKLDK